MSSTRSSTPPAPTRPGSLAATVLRLALLDLRLLLRERSTWIWAFVMPPLFFFFFGAMTGGGSAGEDPPPEVIAVLVEEPGLRSTTPEPTALRSGSGDAGRDDSEWLIGPLTRRLEEMDFEVVEDPDLPVVARLMVPAGTTARALAGETSTLRLELESQGLRADERTFRIQRAVYTTLADFAAADLTRRRGLATDQEPAALTAADLDRLAALPRSIELSVRPAGARQSLPSGYEQAVPGNLVMFVLLVMLSIGSSTLVEERQRGVLRRLASSPIGRGGTVAAKGLARLALGLIQVAVAVAVGSFVFGMDWGPGWPRVAWVLVAWVAFCVALCLLLAQLGRSPGQTSTLGVLSSLLLAALGGSWWPIEIAPAWMQQLTTLLPSGWTMDALHRLINFQSGSVAPHLAGLAVATVACLIVATRRFRFL